MPSGPDFVWTLFYPHQKRGSAATKDMGILPSFKGVLCHDHWAPYYRYTDCLHALCNAHHIRELERAIEDDKQQWAQQLLTLLLEVKESVEKNEGAILMDVVQAQYKSRYLEILALGEKECPLPPLDPTKPKTRGRIKKSKSRNLLERLRDFQDDTLRFMMDSRVPFTNNLAENDLRMTKVHQKISGCFRSPEGALIFCRIRSYLSTCRKHGVNMTEALSLLFRDKMPDFVVDST